MTEVTARAVGEQLIHGRFRRIAVAGRGSFGRVLEVVDVQTDERRALKIVPHGPHESTLLDEFEQLARLRHPSLPRVFEVGRTQEAIDDVPPGAAFFVAEWIAGAHSDARSWTSAATVWSLLADVGGALATIHAAGLVHADVAPQNLLVTDERAILVDLGLGAATGTLGARGTPAYMAPEALAGHVEPRSDLYSLGATVIRLITGRPPFEGATLGELAQRIVTGRPAPPLPGIPRPLADLIGRLAHRDPDARPASALAVLDELDQLAPAIDIGPTSRRARPNVGPPPAPASWPGAAPFVAALAADLATNHLVIVVGSVESGARQLVDAALRRRQLDEVAHGGSSAPTIAGELDAVGAQLDIAPFATSSAAATRSWIERVGRAAHDAPANVVFELGNDTRAGDLLSALARGGDSPSANPIVAICDRLPPSYDRRRDLAIHRIPPLDVAAVGALAETMLRRRPPVEWTRALHTASDGLPLTVVELLRSIVDERDPLAVDWAERVAAGVVALRSRILRHATQPAQHVATAIAIWGGRARIDRVLATARVANPAASIWFTEIVELERLGLAQRRRSTAFEGEVVDEVVIDRNTCDAALANAGAAAVAAAADAALLCQAPFLESDDADDRHDDDAANKLRWPGEPAPRAARVARIASMFRAPKVSTAELAGSDSDAGRTNAGRSDAGRADIGSGATAQDVPREAVITPVITTAGRGPSASETKLGRSDIGSGVTAQDDVPRGAVITPVITTAGRGHSSSETKLGRSDAGRSEAGRSDAGRSAGRSDAGPSDADVATAARGAVAAGSTVRRTTRGIGAVGAVGAAGARAGHGSSSVTRIELAPVLEHAELDDSTGELACDVAEELLGAGRGDRALALARRAIAVVPARAGLIAARAAAAISAYGDVPGFARTAVDAGADPIEADLVVARAAQRAGALDDAEATLARLHAEHPAHAEVAGTYARLLVTRSRYTDARQIALAGGPLAGLRAEAAGLAAFYLGELADADAAFAALELGATAANDSATIGRALSLRGMVAQQRGQLGLASDRYHDAARRLHEVGELHAAAVAELNLGTVLSERGRASDALPRLAAAARVFADLGATTELIAADLNRGNALLAVGQLQDAQLAAEAALARAGGAPHLRAFALLVAGDASRRLGDEPRALGYYQAALAIGVERDDAHAQISAHVALAEAGQRAAPDVEVEALCASQDDRDRWTVARGRLALRTGDAHGGSRTTGAHAAFGSNGSHAAVGGTGSHVLGGSGSHAGLGGSGSHAALGGAGSHAALGGAGSHAALGDTGSNAGLGDTSRSTSSHSGLGGSGSHPALVDAGSNARSNAALGGTGSHTSLVDAGSNARSNAALGSAGSNAGSNAALGVTGSNAGSNAALGGADSHAALGGTGSNAGSNAALGGGAGSNAGSNAALGGAGSNAALGGTGSNAGSNAALRGAGSNAALAPNVRGDGSRATGSHAAIGVDSHAGAGAGDASRTTGGALGGDASRTTGSRSALTVGSSSTAPYLRADGSRATGSQASLADGSRSTNSHVVLSATGSHGTIGSHGDRSRESGSHGAIGAYDGSRASGSYGSIGAEYVLLARACSEVGARAADGDRIERAFRAHAVASRLAVRANDQAFARAEGERARAAHAAMLAAAAPAFRVALESDPDLAQLPAATAVAAVAPRELPLRRLLTLSRRLNSEASVERILDEVIDTAIELTNAERGFLLLRQADGELAPSVSRNFVVGELEASATLSGISVSRSIAERAAQTGEPVMTVDAGVDERFGAAASVAALRLRSVLVVPLRQRGTITGCIYVDHRLRGGAFDDTAASVLGELADIAAIAIENARLTADLRRTTYEVDQLNARLSAELADKDAELVRVKADLPDRDRLRHRYERIVGRSPATVRMLDIVDRATATSLPVVVVGESGTGKELIARALHDNGPRKDGPFVAINCSAVPETLLESELFGHVRGSFTGADRDRRGLFEVADGGTLFLDEIADTGAAMQAKLLRVLQDGVVRRVGDTKTRVVDVRVIAATQTPLAELVTAGRFREDLRFRVEVIAVPIPALRDRDGDIPLLVERLLAHLCTGKTPPRLTRAAMRALGAHRWPGNIRELENALARGVAMGGDVIDVNDLPEAVATAAGRPEPTKPTLGEDLRLKPALTATEQAYITAAMGRAKNNQTVAARLLGLSRFGLQKKLRRLAGNDDADDAE